MVADAPDYALLALEGRWATLYSLAQVSVHISLKEDLAGGDTYKVATLKNAASVTVGVTP